MFKVINGDKAASADHATDLRKRWRQLDAIKQTLDMRESARMGPRTNVAFLSGVAIGLGVMCFFAGLAEFGLHLRDGAFYLVPLAAAIMGMYLVGSRSKRPKTWTAQLDQELTAYEPIDEGAYRQLQQQTRDAGYLESRVIRHWLDLERDAIQVADERRKTSHHGFLSKKL